MSLLPDPPGTGPATPACHVAAGEARGRWVAYLIGLAVGLAMLSLLLDGETVLGRGGLWRWPAADLAQALTGHLALQADRWRWPPLLAGNLAAPRGMSIALTDSNPLVSLLARPLAGLLGHPVNLLGAWLAACFLAQPVAAVFALRGFGTAPALRRGATGALAALAAAVLAATLPALLARHGHINLLGHAYLLLALGLALRLGRDLAWGAAARRRWVAAGAVLLAAILSHPTLFLLSAAVLAGPAAQALVTWRPDGPRQGGWRRGSWHQGGWRHAVALALATGVPVLLSRLLAGPLGGGDKGFGYFSMNLLSPVWPQRSGVFGAGLPVLDATGGQYEGFNYLGAGGLLLLAAAAVLGGRPLRAGLRRHRGLALVLLGLVLLALTPRVHAGPLLVLPLPLAPWDQVFAPMRSSGRAFWPVGYALLLGAVAVLARRLPWPGLAALLALALALQGWDTAPLRAEARAAFSGAGQSPPALVLPAGIARATVGPLCLEGPDAPEADALRLAALRGGAVLGGIRTARPPAWFNCESDASDLLETPLAPAELRILVPATPSPPRRDALGEGAECRRQGRYVLCARGLPLAGEPLPPGPPLPVLAAPAMGAALGPFLSAGWAVDPPGAVWSEGPRATLLLRLPPGAAGAVLRLRLSGIAREAGGARPVLLRLGQGDPVAHSLPDGVETVLDLPLGDQPGEVARVALDLFRPVDPARRGMAAPVRRAGLRLHAVSLHRP